jgi:hypothetical protein
MNLSIYVIEGEKARYRTVWLVRTLYETGDSHKLTYISLKSYIQNC